MITRSAILFILLSAFVAIGAQRLTTYQPVVVCDTTVNTTCAPVSATTGLVVNGSGSTQPISGSVSQTGTWTVQPGNTPNTTAWLVSQGAAPSVTTTMLSGVTGTSNGTVLAVDGQRIAHVTIVCSVSCVGTTITFEGQNDASNFGAIYGIRDGTSTIATTTTPATTVAEGWTFSVGGLKQLRTRVSTYGSGTVNAVGTTHVNGELPPVVNANVVSSNNSTNVTQLGGTTIDTNSGVKSAGTQRVVLATDQPQLTAKLLVTPDANSSVNFNQLTGSTPTVVSNKLGVALFDSLGSNITASTDACDGSATTVIAGSVTADTQLLGASGASNKYYYCMIAISNGGAANENVSIVESTTAGGTCTASPSAVIGSTTDSSGWLVAASGGGAVFNRSMRGPLTNAASCIKVNTAGIQINYVIAYVVAP